VAEAFADGDGDSMHDDGGEDEEVVDRDDDSEGILVEIHKELEEDSSPA
jgi:hypothetical protein